MSAQQQNFPGSPDPVELNSLRVRFADCLCAIFFVVWILLPRTCALSGPLFWSGLTWTLIRFGLYVAPGQRRS